MTTVEVQLADITKDYGKTRAVDHLDLQIFQGEFFAILGPSGCGKTSTLRIIGGLETPSSGEVFIRGKSVTSMPPYKRNIGMVFQSYALFPHMTVFDNIAFGLLMRGWAKTRIAERVKQLLEVIRLPGVSKRYPVQLSGGEQQRIALARALAPEPSVLLLDEPLSNLDLKLRQELRLEIRRIQKELGVTTIFVTHDQGEALSLSDRVLVMRSGRTIQMGKPVELYEHPRTRWVASFLGDANIFTGSVRIGPNDNICLETMDGLRAQIELAADLLSLRGNGPITLAIRPEAITLAAIGDSIDLQRNTVVPGVVENFAYGGSGTRYVLRVESLSTDPVLVDSPRVGAPMERGARVAIVFPNNRWILLEEE